MERDAKEKEDRYEIIIKKFGGQAGPGRSRCYGRPGDHGSPAIDRKIEFT